RLFDKQHAMPPRKAADELLRPLPDKSPAQMAEDDDAGLIVGLAVANDAASAFRRRFFRRGSLRRRWDRRIAEQLERPRARGIRAGWNPAMRFVFHRLRRAVDRVQISICMSARLDQRRELI